MSKPTSGLYKPSDWLLVFIVSANAITGKPTCNKARTLSIAFGLFNLFSSNLAASVGSVYSAGLSQAKFWGVSVRDWPGIEPWNKFYCILILFNYSSYFFLIYFLHLFLKILYIY